MAGGRRAGSDSVTTERGLARRREIVEAAAAILQEQGPSGVSHRSVARRVGCSLSATTYYFDGLDELLAEAGRVNISRWASRAEAVAERAEGESAPTDPSQVVEALLKAMLPAGGDLQGHYLQLVAAGSSAPVTRAYRTGRDRLNSAVGRVLTRVGCAIPAELAIAVVDGAAVSAISEGRDVRETARGLLGQLLRQPHGCGEGAGAGADTA